MNEVIQNDIQDIISYNCGWDVFSNKSILITGATGFIGTELIYSIMERNIRLNEKTEIIALVRSKAKFEKIFHKYLNSKLLTLSVTDLSQDIHLENSVDYIIHCASNAAPDKYKTDPVGTMQTNLIGTDKLLKFAIEKKVKKFIYVSTIEVYGNSSSPNNIREDDYGYISSTNSRSCYSESKKCAELLTYCYGKQYNLSVCIARLSYVYGAGIDRNDTKVCAYFARSVVNEENIILKSKGLQKRSYTYISDIITGILTILAKGESGEAYNIASSDSVISISEFAKMHCNLYKNKKIQVIFEIPTDKEQKAFSFIEDAILNTDKIEVLGWTARVPLHTGIKKSVEYFSE